MSIESARSFFLYCSIINYVFLMAWVVAAIFGRGPLFNLITRMFHVTQEQFGLLNVVGITLYKSAIFLFNIVPCIALYLIK